MNTGESVREVFRDIGDIAIVRIIMILVVAWLILIIDQKLLPAFARRLPGRSRLHVLATVPVIRLVVIIVAVVMVLRHIIDPTLENMIALLGFLGVGLGFALKDYVGSLFAGIVALYENPYRPGDWVTIDGVYGEVQSIKMRSVNILTPDDTLVLIPHNRIWNNSVHNANMGSTNLQCVANFYLMPEHNGAVVRRRLYDVALSSPYVKLIQPIMVVAEETQWGTHYRIRAYPIDPALQFAFITDLTERGKTALLDSGIKFATVGAVAHVGEGK